MRWPSTPRQPRRPGSGDDRSPRTGECASHDVFLGLPRNAELWPAPMIAVCPAGHSSLAQDYCDVCGLPIDPAVTPARAAPPTATSQQPGRQPCPNCGADNSVDALFCESCGYDFTTGTMPRSLVSPAFPNAPTVNPSPLSPTSAVPTTGPAIGNGVQPAETLDWVAEVWIDPAWYEAQQSPDPMPSPGLPVVVPLRSRSILIGRTSRSRNIHPQIDCEPDSGVSRRQTQLTTDRSRWWVEDLDSANGTFVAAATDPIPTSPIPVGLKHELAADDRIYVGAWTRIVIRRATDDERAALS
jgi:FHA domain